VAAPGINEHINFQGKVVNANGTNVADGNYSFTFRIYTVSSGGSHVWTETKTLAVNDGIFVTALGDTTTLPGSVDFNSDNIFLGINFNSDGEMTPRIQFTASPYAFNSDLLDGLDASAFAQLNPASAQSGSLNVTGSVQAATSLQAPLVDTATAAALSVGTGTATSVTVGRATSSTNLTLQGSASTSWSATGASGSTTVNFAAPTATNTITFPNASGTVCTTTASTCSATYQAAGSYLAKNAADTSSASVAGYLLGLTNSNTGSSAGVVSLTNSGTASALSITQSADPAVGQALILANNTDGTPSGNLIDLQTGGVSQFAVAFNGAVTSGTINGQTISSAANFTGTLTAATSLLAPLVDTASGVPLNIGTGTATAVTVGRTSTNFILQGAAGASGSTITATNGGNTTTVRFINPTANRLIEFPNEAGTVCLQNSANCGFLTAATVLAKNQSVSETSTGSVAGAFYAFTNTNTGAAQVLTLSNAGTGSALSVTTSGNPSAGNAVIFGSNTNATPSGNLLDLQSGASPTSKLSVDVDGDVISAGSLTVNGTAANTFAGGLVLSNVATDITTGTNEALTLEANGTGQVILNDLVQVATLGSADTSTTLCRNTSNQIATCVGGGGQSFVQGGNSFSATGVLGTNDAHALEIETGGTTRLTISATGTLTVASGNDLVFAGGASDFDQSASSGTFQSGTGAVTLNGDTTVTSGKNLSVAGGTFTSAGGAISLNNNSNFATGINTGSSTGQITLGGGSAPLVIDSTAFDVTSAGAVSGVTTLNASGLITSVGLNAGAGLIQGTAGLTISGAGASINNNSNFATDINTGSSTGTVTIGGGSAPLVIDSTAFDVSSAGALSGITTISTSSTINGQTISSTANFTGTVVVAGANALTLGTTGTATGAALFKGATAASGTITLIGQANPTGSQTITLPDATGTVCLQSSSSCGFLIGSGNAFVDGGNSFGQAGDLGTNDAQVLNIRTDNATRMTVSTTGSLTWAAGSTGNFDHSPSTGTFATGSGTVSLNGDTTVATNKSFTANGTATFQDATSSISSFRLLSSSGANLLTGNTQDTMLTSAANYESVGYYNNGIGGIGRFGNLLVRSEQFENGSWAKTNLSTTTNAVAGPDAQVTAERINATANGGKITQDYTTAGNNTYTFSVWLKTGSGTQSVDLRIDSNGTPATGTVRNWTATTTWQRFFVTQTFASGVTTVTPSIFPGGTGGTDAVNVYAWGGQLVQDNNPQVYVRTVNAPIAQTSGVVSNGGVYSVSLNPSDVPMITQGDSGQTADLFQAQNSSGTTLFSVSATGAVTMVGVNAGTGLIQGTGGLTVTGAVSINDNFNANTSINTGTSTGTVTIGGGSAPLVIDSTNFDVSSAGAVSGVTTLNASGLVTSVGLNAGTGLIQGTGGLTISGAAASINNNSNFATDINTGSSTGTVTIGGGSAPLVINSTNFDVSSAGAVSGVTTLNASGLVTSVGLNAGAGLVQGTAGLTISGAAASINNNSNFATDINTGSSTGTVTIGGGSAPLVIDSTNFDVSSGGALSGITTIATSSTINGQTISSTANFTGTITAAGTLTLANVATDITSGTNEALTLVANGTGDIVLNDFVQIPTIDSADTSTALCRNAAGRIATCVGGVANSFIQGGNSFTATAVLGTNDAYDLEIETSGTTRLTIGTTGGVTVAANNNITTTAGTGVITQNYTNNTGTGLVLNATNSASSGTTTLSAQGVALVGTNNAGGTNTNIGINFSNVAAATNNSFYGLNFGTGFTDLVRYNGTQLISGAGKIQDAALDNTLTYSNITGVGALNAGSITSGFGTIDNADTITGTTINGTTGINTGASAGTQRIDSSGNLVNIGNITGTAGITIATASAGALALQPSAGGSLTSTVTKNAATGDETAFDFAATINKATSGSYTALKINVTETSAPGANDKLIDLQVATATQMSVSNTGVLNVATGYQIGGAAPAGEYLRGNGTNYVSSTIQAADLPSLTGTYLRNVPTATSDNTINPGANNAVALTARGSSNGANPNILDIRTSGNTLVSYFDFNGAFNTGAAIVAPTSSNTINGLVINAGALSSVTSITASGTIQGATLNATTAIQANGTAGQTSSCAGGEVRTGAAYSMGILTTAGSCASVPVGTFLAKNSADTSTAAANAGFLYGFTNSGTGTGTGVLSLTNSNSGGTGSVLSVTSAANSASGQALILANNTNGTPTGNLIDLQVSAVSKFNVSVGGVVTLAGNQTTDIGVQAAAASTTGNSLTLTAGTGGSGNTNGGTATLQGGAATGTGTGGTAYLRGGAATTTGAGGSIQVLAANGGSSAANGIGPGGNITLQAGSAQGSNDNNGGSIFLTAGTRTGSSGVPGIVSISSPVFNSVSQTFTQTSNGQSFPAAGGETTTLQNNLDSYGTIVMNVTGAFTGSTVTMPNPSNTTAGHVVYVSAASGSVAFTLAATGMSSVNMSSGNTATLVWNGSGWSGTTTASSLQQVYNNTSTSPASIITTSSAKNILFQAGVGFDNANVFQVGNSAAAPVINIDTRNTATGANLATNGGVESGTTGWTAFAGTGSASISQNTNAANLASGLGSIDVNITGAGTGGVANSLSSTALAADQIYNVSFNIKSSSGTPTIAVTYLEDGSALDATCNVPTNGTVNSTNFFKYTCSFTTGPSGQTTSNTLRIAQTDSTIRHLYIDNLSLTAQNSTGTQNTGSLQVGGPLSQGLTLFTLDTFAADPFTGAVNQNLYGSMYYNTTLGRIQCYESSGWGTCGAAPDSNLILEPEYAGAVLNPGIAADTHIGTMTANICSGSSRMGIQPPEGTICSANEEFNYYKWTTSQVTAQTFSIFVKYQLPPTFGGFMDNNTIKMVGRVSNTTDASVAYAVFQDDGVQCGGTPAGTTAVTSTANTWQEVSYNGSEATVCDFQPNDIITFRVDMSSRNNAFSYAGRVTFTMKGK
jgi:hypothetical protein